MKIERETFSLGLIQIDASDYERWLRILLSYPFLGDSLDLTPAYRITLVKNLFITCSCEFAWWAL